MSVFIRGAVSLRVFFCEEFGYCRLGIPVGYTSELKCDCKTSFKVSSLSPDRRIVLTSLYKLTSLSTHILSWVTHNK